MILKNMSYPKHTLEKLLLNKKIKLNRAKLSIYKKYNL